MNTFQSILALPGAALIFADKVSGRIIGRITDGFDEDPALHDMMCLYRAVEEKYPDQVLSLREMYDVQLSDAAKGTEDSNKALEGLTPEQRAVWESEPTRSQTKVQRLQAALPKIVDLYSGATPNSESWDKLTPINQWSLLNATERGLHSRLVRYRGWAKQDEESGRETSNAITLRDQADKAIKPLYDLITKFLKDEKISQALREDAANGIRVPSRRVA